MPRFYFIELAYRSINFLAFLNDSLDNWDLVLNEKEQYTLSQKQSRFRNLNNQNLIKYQENEKKNEDHPQKLNYEKVELINNGYKKIILIHQKNCPLKKLMN